MSEGDPPPERLRIVGTVERVNREAAAAGQNGKVKAAKGVIQLRKVNENHWQLWLSVAKDLDGQRYDIENVQRLRTNFINEGKLTIEFRQPPFNVMLRDCKPLELQALLQRIKTIKQSDSRLKSIQDSIDEKREAKEKTVVQDSLNLNNSKSILGPSSKTVLGRATKTVPGNSSKTVPGSATKTVPGSSLKSVPGSSLKSDPGSSLKTVPGSSLKTFPGSSLKTVPGSSLKTVPGSSLKTVPGSSSQTVPNNPSRKGPEIPDPKTVPKQIPPPNSTLNNVPETSSRILPKRENNSETPILEDKPVRTGLKRPLASTDMSKKELSSIRKSLKLATGSLVISDRSDYPLRGFPPDLKRLSCNNLLLRKIDYRLQDLFHLKFLSMPDNRISSIDMLAHMKSRLENVNFSNNQIEKIGEEVFRSKALMNLKVLNLNGNQIRCLPNTILDLSNLMELHLSNNQLQVLPYNLHRLSSLLLLKLNGNRLGALPSPISLMNLNYLDISTNPFPHVDTFANVKKRVQLEPAVTLFEKAGAALLSYLHSKRVNSICLDPSILPKIVIDYLSSAKYCRQCGKMVLRYLITYQSSSQSLAQEFVRYSREYPVCLIRCDKCSRNEF